MHNDEEHLLVRRLAVGQPAHRLLRRQQLVETQVRAIVLARRLPPAAVSRAGCGLLNVAEIVGPAAPAACRAHRPPPRAPSSNLL